MKLEKCAGKMSNSTKNSFKIHPEEVMDRRTPQSFQQAEERTSNYGQYGFPGDYCTMFRFTDASDYHWGEILVQSRKERMNDLVKDREYESLLF